MSFHSLMQHAKNHPLSARPSHGVNGYGLKGFVVDKGERYGAAAGFGYLKGRFGEKFMFRGQGYDLWLGGILGIAAVGLNAWTGGHSSIAPHLERVGDAGMSSWFNSYFTAMGMRHGGTSVAVLSEGKGKKRWLSGYAIWALPPAGVGAYLTPQEMANWSSK